MSKIGRPTKYRKSFIKRAEIYLKECKNERKVPFLEEIAMRLEVSEDSIRRWSEANEDFCGAIDRIKDYQRLALKTLGLKSPAVIIFLLRTNHGYIEAEKIQHGGTKEESLNIIFTDSTTWKRPEDNRNKFKSQTTHPVSMPQVQPLRAAVAVGGYDWTHFSSTGRLTEAVRI